MLVNSSAAHRGLAWRAGIPGTIAVALLFGCALASPAGPRRPASPLRARVARVELLTVGRAAALPGYASRLDRRIAWAKFPLSVYFVRDARFTPARKEAALRGMDDWVHATGGMVQYSVVESPAKAQVFVHFEAGTD